MDIEIQTTEIFEIRGKTFAHVGFGATELEIPFRAFAEAVAVGGSEHARALIRQIDSLDENNTTAGCWLVSPLSALSLLRSAYEEACDNCKDNGGGGWPACIEMTQKRSDNVVLAYRTWNSNIIELNLWFKGSYNDEPMSSLRLDWSNDKGTDIGCGINMRLKPLMKYVERISYASTRNPEDEVADE